MEFEDQREALARMQWEEQAKKLMKEDMEMINRVARIKEVPLGRASVRASDTSLPSRFQIGDEVIIKAKVKGVQFVDGKVSYCFWLDEKLHTITSDHVEASNGILSVAEAK